VEDDSELLRVVILTFREKAGFEVCGEAADDREAIEKAQELKPKLIVLDLSMPGMNGAEAASVLGELMPEVPILVLTMYGDVPGLSMAAGLGVEGIVAKAEA
jgi:response regulator NasT